MADAATRKAFREIEKELDALHEGLPFFQVPAPNAAYALLTAFDGFYALDLAMAMVGEIDVASTQYRKKFEDGLSQALRWVVRDPQDIDFTSISDLATIEIAGEYITHAADYYNIADFHAMFGRKLVDVEVDQANKKVRFIPPPDQTALQSIMGYAETVENLKNIRVVRRPQDIQPLAEEAIPFMASFEHELVDGRVVLTNLSQLSDARIVAYSNFLLHEFEDIDPGADLSGFTVDQFQRFWSVLARWSQSAVQIYFTRASSGTPQNQCMPTQCVPKDKFITAVSDLSGLDVPVVTAITERLRWGPSITNPDIFLQPLVVGANTVLWSPRVIDISRYPRNLLRLITKLIGPVKDVADNLIGDREIPATKRLGLFLANKERKGWQYKLRRKVAADGEKGEIDYLGWNSSCWEEVLLIEYKATLDVDEINEVNSATDEMIIGQTQLERCIRILGKLSVAEKRALYPFVPWDKIKKIYGIVVSSGCEPNEKYDHSVMPGISAAALYSRVPKKDFVRPSRLSKSCQERSWLSQLNDLDHSEHEVKIGPLTYCLPSLTSRDENDTAA